MTIFHAFFICLFMTASLLFAGASMLAPLGALSALFAAASCVSGLLMWFVAHVATEADHAA